MLSRNFSTRLPRVFNMLVCPVCLYNVLNYISPGVLFKCQISFVLCNYGGKGRIKKQNLSTKESWLPLLTCEGHLLHALETPPCLNCLSSALFGSLHRSEELLLCSFHKEKVSQWSLTWLLLLSWVFFS